MPFFEKPIKSALPFFFIVLLSFTGCSNLEPATTSQISFTINAARKIITDSLEPSEIFIDVELKGGYEASKSAVLTPDKDNTFTFDKVPVGKNVYISALLYTKYGEEKLVLYHGKTEEQEIVLEGNSFQLSFKKDFNVTIKTDSTYVVSRPLFYAERDKNILTTNKLEFKNDANAPSQAFVWELAELDEYQKVRMTFKGDTAATSDTTNSHAFVFQFGSTTCGAHYVNEKLSVTAEKSVCEFEIPQYVNAGTIRLENDYIIGESPEQNKWAEDFNLYIEKIELIKDSSLLDPDFNQITKTENTYTVKNPAIICGTAVQVEKNHITFNSLSRMKRYKSPFSAAYWICKNITDYDKVTLTIKCNNSSEDGLRLELKGYKPVHYPDLKEDKRSDYNAENLIGLSNPDAGAAASPYTRTFTTDITNLMSGLSASEFQALEFINLSFNDDYDDPSAWKDLDVEILEIRLIKRTSSQIGIDVDNPDTSDITVTQDTNSQPGKIIFTAQATYESYTWKVNGQIQEEATGNVFVFDLEKLPDGQTTRPAGLYDISLLADTHSWSTQITKN